MNIVTTMVNFMNVIVTMVSYHNLCLVDLVDIIVGWEVESIIFCYMRYALSCARVGSKHIENLKLEMVRRAYDGHEWM